MKDQINLKVLNQQIEVEYSIPSTINFEDYTKINFGSIDSEKLSFSEQFGQISLARSLADSSMQNVKKDLDVLKAVLDGEFRSGKRNKHELFQVTIDSKGFEKTKQPTENQIEQAIKRDPEYVELLNDYSEYYKSYQVLDGLYWSMKTKENTLNYLSYNNDDE